ncbi:MAG: DUF6653 family protein [Pseudomonadota bacterium]
MDIYKSAERLMLMDDAAWARHANPWSLWTRIAALPLLIAAIWSRVWLGWWALVPIAVALAWIWLNPRAFSRPSRYDTWAARGVIGERLFLARGELEIPTHHLRMASILTCFSAIGAVPLIYGLVVLDPGMTLAGWVGTALPKIWFVDRMVWIHDDMQRMQPGVTARFTPTPAATPV